VNPVQQKTTTRPVGSDLIIAAPVGVPTLNDPLRLPCGVHLSNRLVRSALSEGLAEEGGRPGSGLARLYRAWSVEDGYSVVITGNVMVDRTQLGEPGNAVLEDDRDLGRFAEWASAGKAGGNQLWMQINHPGRQANHLVNGIRPVAPSPVSVGIPGASVPRALRPAEIEDIIKRFAEAARLAKAAGFDGVQLHGAHGYLISQFLSPLANQRDDDWGGDPARRRRFVLEAVRATRAAVGPDFPVAIKLNSADFQRGGFSEEESMDLLEYLAAERLDLIEVSGGTYSAPAMMGKATAESTRQREAYFQTYAEEARRRVPGTPIVLTGGFRTRQGMDEALADGACDLVGIGRAPCLDPLIGTRLIDRSQLTAPVGDINVGLRTLVGRLTDLRPLDGALDLQWHSDQMHRMARGLEPDPQRSWQRTLLGMVRRYGPLALRPGKRG
jgi:2,4-dienoyl-CoA reductase-like NADH-dependent reductase (Old Yellow Enzyme family)